MVKAYHALWGLRSTKMSQVSDQDNQLAAMGIPRIDPEASPRLYAELFRIARRVRESERTMVGLLPTGPNVAVAPLAVELGYAVADACEGAVAVVDANVRWPWLQGFGTPKDELSKKSGFRTTWLADFVAVMTPTVSEGTGGMSLEGLDTLLREEMQGFVHVLVDLTGFEHTGEHWGMFETLDGVLLIGHAGVTREQDLLRLYGDIPQGVVLGVVLIG